MSGVLVGDGFIRPEITSFCVNGRYPARIDERAYLGTDKSVPYKLVYFSFVRLSWGTCRGRIYPSRGTPLINLGRVTSINAERSHLGTDKSVPYKKPANSLTLFALV
ncbi:MAG: hypothetical protein FWG87_03720 [Defluviitaleaceae bacterium]|nr:hypothetical protein [Defluviitaleaceae bacterium]